MITAGIDMGYRDIKVVILKNGNILVKEKAEAGFEQGKVAEKVLENAIKKARLSRKELEQIGVTGSGRKYAPPHDIDITEIGAAAKGAYYLFPSAKTVIDCGAEDSRGIKIGEGGIAKDFTTNDKCAAGAGAFVEAMARAIQVNLEEFGELGLQSSEAIPINSQCAVFAESEVVSLIHKELPKSAIARAVCDALGERLVAMVKRIGVEREIVVVGGMARLGGFVEALKRGFKSEVLVPENPEFVGALGAALAAREEKKGA